MNYDYFKLLMSNSFFNINFNVSAGACGYKTYSTTINGGEVSGASYKLFKNGNGWNML